MTSSKSKMSVAVDFENLKKTYKFPFEKLKEKQTRVVETVVKGKYCFAIFYRVWQNDNACFASSTEETIQPGGVFSACNYG